MGRGAQDQGMFTVIYNLNNQELGPRDRNFGACLEGMPSFIGGQVNVISDFLVVSAVLETSRTTVCDFATDIVKDWCVQPTLTLGFSTWAACMC